ncbi:hypothetical protein D9M71_801270 [compost metagenome]
MALAELRYGQNRRQPVEGAGQGENCQADAGYVDSVETGKILATANGQGMPAEQGMARYEMRGQQRQQRDPDRQWQPQQAL